ncbi:MAG: laccase domain-containing protein [Verrucomicrobiales bacterium]|nr:laccase domain-containing protein [Verrucomicrobiales bacterium]
MESFPALDALHSVVRHAFVRRIPGIDLSLTKQDVVAQLDPWHQQAVTRLGFPPESLWMAEQVHGAAVAAVPQPGARPIPGVDGLLTNQPGTVLGIHVADCGPVYVVDPVRRAIALLHSGRKGSEQDITGRAVLEMAARFGSRPADLIVQLGPCIRPPAYEVDFAAWIRASALAAGVPENQFHDCGICTHADPQRYDSYRRDLGRTGRLLALLGLPSVNTPT